MRREDGAILAMVAISLLALLGMLTLVVDLGQRTATRTTVGTAADAAALAAAQACAFGDDPADAAGTLASENGAVLDGPVTCGAGTVAVQARAQVTYFFAPLFGIDGSSVSASATAAWDEDGKVRLIR